MKDVGTRKAAAAAVCGLACLVVVAACSSKSGTDAPPPAAVTNTQSSAAAAGVLEWELVQGEAVVQSIDAPRRLVVLRNAQGKTLTLKVGKTVDLTKVHAGDSVAITYYEAVALTIGQPGSGTPGVSGAVAVAPAVRGQVPAGAEVEQVKVTSAIVANDPATHTLTVRGPDGNLRTITVKDPQMQQQAAALQVGDVIELTYTEGVAMQVVPKAI